MGSACSGKDEEQKHQIYHMNTKANMSSDCSYSSDREYSQASFSLNHDTRAENLEKQNEELKQKIEEEEKKRYLSEELAKEDEFKYKLRLIEEKEKRLSAEEEEISKQEEQFKKMYEIQLREQKRQNDVYYYHKKQAEELSKLESENSVYPPSVMEVIENNFSKVLKISTEKEEIQNQSNSIEENKNDKKVSNIKQQEKLK